MPPLMDTFDSGALWFSTIENDVNSFACHCCETINRSVIMVGKLLIFFFSSVVFDMLSTMRR